MPVQKFKTYNEAREALWCFSPDADYYHRLKDFWATVALLHPRPAFPQGITKFKTVAEANQHMDDWLLQSRV